MFKSFWNQRPLFHDEIEKQKALHGSGGGLWAAGQTVLPGFFYYLSFHKLSFFSAKRVARSLRYSDFSISFTHSLGMALKPR